MALEQANNISELDLSSPPGGDPLSQADDHLRLIKKVMKQTFPGSAGNGFSKPIVSSEDELNFVKGVTASIQDQLNDLATALAEVIGEIPIGGIINYNGLVGDIPTNYQLCDGTNGTPNMVDKFVYGTIVQGQIGLTGGSADAIVVDHEHVLNDPGHQHTVDDALPQNDNSGGWSLGNDAARNDVLDTSNEVTGITIDSAGVDGTDANIPPYLKLAFIRRMS